MRKTVITIVFLAICPLLLAQQTLNNDSVIKMVKMGFSEDMIVTAINRSPGTYDTSVDGLITLKKAGVGSKAISAMVAKPSVVTPAPAQSVPVSEVVPAGMQATSQRIVPALATPVKQAANSTQRLQVRIIDRQDKEDGYEYAAVYNNVAVGKAFKAYGATFTLQVPDGRLTIVNCESKFAEHMAGRVGNRRSCRTPLVDSIEADFNGDNAKLIWPVSLHGRKMQSETYKIHGILDKPNTKWRMGEQGYYSRVASGVYAVDPLEAYGGGMIVAVKIVPTEDGALTAVSADEQVWRKMYPSMDAATSEAVELQIMKPSRN